MSERRKRVAAFASCASLVLVYVASRGFPIAEWALCFSGFLNLCLLARMNYVRCMGCRVWVRSSFASDRGGVVACYVCRQRTDNYPWLSFGGKRRKWRKVRPDWVYCSRPSTLIDGPPPEKVDGPLYCGHDSASLLWVETFHDQDQDDKKNVRYYHAVYECPCARAGHSRWYTMKAPPKDPK
jgi:hypothetical protein